MTEFEKSLIKNQLAVERFVKFKVSDKSDADDILQEIFCAAYRGFDSLKSKESFKPWILGIARNKCRDYFRERAKNLEIPLDGLTESDLTAGRFGYIESDSTEYVLEKLCEKDRQILYLAYWEKLKLSEIANRLNIPLGTVKSRLHTAKSNVKKQYPNITLKTKGETIMNILPDSLPEYKIVKSEKAPFSVKYEELIGLSIIPRLGEKAMWGLYDYATKKCDEYSEVSVTGKAEVHGIEGVEITSIQHDIKNNQVNERQFVAQLTDTHCRYLSEAHKENGVKKHITFLDGELFMNNWGFGKDNCGNETLLKPKNLIKRDGNTINNSAQGETLDIVGCYTVEILGKSFDTVCVMDLGCYNNLIAIEQYIDKNGRLILWRRFNRDDWALKRYGKRWSEQLPQNERLIINGETYVHWYDCLTNYII